MDMRRWEKWADESNGHFAIALALLEIAKAINNSNGMDAADIIDGGLTKVADALSGIPSAITDLDPKK